MRDCVFLVPDIQTAALVKGFLGRDKCHLSLGCGAFEFDAAQDLVIDPNRDPGVYNRGFQIIAGFANTHRRAVVILDAEWEGSPGAEAIHRKISQDLQRDWHTYFVVVLVPEIEAWLWQDNHHVVRAFGAADYATLRAELQNRGFWRDHDIKPHRPKEAVEFALRRARIPRSGSLYGTIASRLSVKSCVDPGFRSLTQCLGDWFGAPE